MLGVIHRVKEGLSGSEGLGEVWAGSALVGQRHHHQIRLMENYLLVRALWRVKRLLDEQEFVGNSFTNIQEMVGIRPV